MEHPKFVYHVLPNVEAVTMEPMDKPVKLAKMKQELMI
jgi:hypothetical protein